MNRSQLLALQVEIQSHPELYPSPHSYAVVAGVLNATSTQTVPNPETQQNILKPIAMIDIIEIALEEDPENTATLSDALAPMADRFERDLAERDERAINWYLAVHGAMLNSNAQAAIQARLIETYPDPSYSETLTLTMPSRASALGIPVVKPEDVMTALHLKG